MQVIIQYGILWVDYSHCGPDLAPPRIISSKVCIADCGVRLAMEGEVLGWWHRKKIPDKCFFLLQFSSLNGTFCLTFRHNLNRQPQLKGFEELWFEITQ